MSGDPLRLIPGNAIAPGPVHASELSDVVRKALAGHEDAIATLVARFDRLLRSTARSYGLDRWDVDDVVQHSWMQFLEHGTSLREPRAITGWLVTTARRHSLRVLQAHVRERLTDEPMVERVADDGVELDAEILANETRAAVYASLSELTERQRELMTLLIEEPHL